MVIISSPSLLPLSLCFLLLCHGSMAQMPFGEGQERSPWPWGSQRRFGQEGECQLDKLDALEPTRRVQSEAGVTEYFDENNQQLRCAGVSAFRRTIEPKGLLLPSYFNAPSLVYIIQGEGVTGTVIPGCPESFQSFQPRMEGKEQEGQSQRPTDQHQRVYRFRQGDIIAWPAGLAHWCYNDGETPVVAVVVQDTSNNANQLDRNPRQFLLAGSQQQGGQQEQRSGDNIFGGFDLDILAEALGVSREVARKIQRQERRQGEMVRVERGLQLVRPPARMHEGEAGSKMNGLEQAFCSKRFIENIDNPRHADIYTPQGGRITNFNSRKLPMLEFIQMSAERGVLHKDAILTPHWTINAHSVVYVTKGRTRVQIVGDQGRRVFDGELRQGQLVVVPQNFAVMNQAIGERFEWISFMTNDNAMSSQIAGRSSVLSGMPVDVIVNSYPGMSREEAMMVKSNRREHDAIIPPRSQQGRSDDA